MNKTERNLTKKQLRAIPLILQAKSITEGVEKAGISKTTFYEWMKNPKFKLEWTEQRKEIISLALDELKAGAGEAVRVLKELLNAESEAIRLKTAMGILEHISKFMDIEDIQKRLELLEEVLYESKK